MRDDGASRGRLPPARRIRSAVRKTTRHSPHPISVRRRARAERGRTSYPAHWATADVVRDGVILLLLYSASYVRTIASSL